MPGKYLRIISFLLLSALLQLGVFYGLERQLHSRSGIDLEPAKVTKVREREITLNPSPLSPRMMAVSADHTRLAVMESDRLKIYDLADGREIHDISLEGDSPGAMQWLPDRNRLIFALINRKNISKIIKEPLPPQVTGVKDETYSSEVYRQTRTIVTQGFQITIYSLDGQAGAAPEPIQTLRQAGSVPQHIDLNLSTYTNLLYVHWIQNKQDSLAQIDIMKRIKDIRLPRGELTKLVVTPRTGDLWAELSEDGVPWIYKYKKGRWKLQKHLDGYRLLGVTPDEQLAVAPDSDQDGRITEVLLADEKGALKPGWAFSSPIRLNNVSILKDGRLLYFDQKRIIIHTPQLGKGTVFNIRKVDAYAPDGKMMLSWQENSGQIKIMEENEETGRK